jgi:hypothetical protein
VVALLVTPVTAFVVVRTLNAEKEPTKPAPAEPKPVAKVPHKKPAAPTKQPQATDSKEEDPFVKSVKPDPGKQVTSTPPAESAKDTPPPSDTGKKDTVPPSADAGKKDPPPTPVRRVRPDKTGQFLIPDFSDFLNESPDKPPKAGSRDKGLVMPLEVVDFKDKTLAYRVRRLKLPERPARPLRVAVTPRQCDDMGSLLRTMGDGFRNFTEIDRTTLKSVEKLKHFDVIFLTCSILENWGNDTSQALRKFVEDGGTLYASDFRYNLVVAAFPEYGVPSPPGAGIEQTVLADVTNADLKRYLGKAKLPLRFDMDAWHPAAFDRDRTLTLIDGTYRATDGSTQSSPLLVKFRHGLGVVIFTSFHNAKQNNALEKKLLEYLVMSVVNARAEAHVTDLMVQAGFSPQALQSSQASAKQAGPTRTYRHTKGGLQVAVGFNEGARLRLMLVAPDGKKVEYEDGGTFLVEVPDAAAGEWRYSVRAVNVPFDHFPYVVAVAKTR